MSDVRGALLVAGTTSDAGKTVLVTGLCRWLRRRGVRVAPFKAQNMSNNAMVTGDGAEIGRAQWVQAVAAGAEPEPAMNPVLLKPGSDLRSHVVLMGRPYGDLEARSFADARGDLAAAAHAAFDDLRRRYDVVVCEGAGSPAEVNLREHDFVNMGLARHGRVPTVVVGDIDRGGVLAAMYGTLALLSPADQELVRGFVVNKFRGDRDLLEPGLTALEERTGRPVLGVLPWLEDLWLDSEDALDLDAGGAPASRRPLRVRVVRLPRISNFTDVDALAAEPGVDLRFTVSPEEVRDAELVIVPGTRSTADDLAWLRDRGLGESLSERHARARPVLGICGGFQMLGDEIADPDGVESAHPVTTDGLGLLPVRTRFEDAKTLARPTGRALGQEVSGYTIHHGRTEVAGGEPFLGGCRVGETWGTPWHGVLEADGFRRSFLAEVARAAGRPDWAPGEPVAFASLREARIDALADAVEQHLDTAALLGLIREGAARS